MTSHPADSTLTTSGAISTTQAQELLKAGKIWTCPKCKCYISSERKNCVVCDKEGSANNY